MELYTEEAETSSSPCRPLRRILIQLNRIIWTLTCLISQQLSILSTRMATPICTLLPCSQCPPPSQIQMRRIILHSRITLLQCRKPSHLYLSESHLESTRELLLSDFLMGNRFPVHRIVCHLVTSRTLHNGLYVMDSIMGC